MPRDRDSRLPVDFRPEPLAREREGCRLTKRPLTARMAEVVERLGIVAETAAPKLPPKAWDLICWAGWDAISTERIMSRDRPQDIDALAWTALIHSVVDWIDGHEHEAAPAWAEGLPERLGAMSPVERIAVLERIEAYGRAAAAHTEEMTDDQSMG